MSVARYARAVGRTFARGAASVGIVAIEIAGCICMWAPVPLAWMWVGGRVYRLTGSLLADLVAAFGGFTLIVMLTMGALNRIDARWVQLRRDAGHDQREGALTRVVVVSS